MKEFRLVEKHASVADPPGDAESFRHALGSFLELKRRDQEMAAEYPDLALPELKKPLEAVVDVPMTIGRGRCGG